MGATSQDDGNPAAGGGRQKNQPTENDAVASGEVLRGQQELHIDHGGAIYTLRVTRQGKLILTK